jgi:hypothetical protein
MKKYPELTPYQFASNSPTGGIDADGLEFKSTFASTQKGDFERKIEVQNTYNGSTLSSYDPSKKSFSQSWRDSKNFFARLSYNIANGLYTFPQQLSSGIRGADYIYNIGGNAYHANGIEDEKQRLNNFVNFAGTIIPGAPAEVKAVGLFNKAADNALLKIEHEATEQIATQLSKEVEVTTTKNLFGGNSIALIEGQTTTIIGRFKGGVEHIIATGEFRTGANPGGLNVLNIKIWNWEKNALWMKEAINRKDIFRVVSDPSKSENIWENGIINGSRTSFGKEVEFLENNGYKFDSKTSEFKAP